jgi:capsular exopolysaccharide synthesis family protein
VLALGLALLVSAVLTTGVFCLYSDQYRAQATLQVAAQQPLILFKTVETGGSGGDDYKRYQRTQLNLIKSRFVLNAAFRDGKVGHYRMLEDKKDPIGWLKENLQVTFVNDSEMMEISLRGEFPKELASLVNAIKQAYMEEVVNVEHKRRVGRYEKLRTLSKQFAKKLESRGDAMRKLAETVGSDDRHTLALRQQYSLEHLASLRKELLEVQSQRRKAEALLKARRPEAVQETAASTISGAEVDRLVEQDPLVTSLADRLVAMEQRLASEAGHVQKVARNAAMDPAVASLRSEVDTLKRSLRKKRAELRPLVIRELQKQLREGSGPASDESKQQIEMLGVLEKQLDAEIKEVSAGNYDFNVNTLDLGQVQDEVSQIRGAAQKVGAEVEALDVELEAPSRIQVIEDAVVPTTNDATKRYTMIGLTGVGSFVGVLFLVAFLELQGQRVGAVDDVIVELGIPVVGALPILPKAKVNRAISRRENDDFFGNLMLESIDATRTMLVHAARSGSRQVIMITSPLPGEGKTSLASHLATSLARAGMRTLLIDADLRCPSLHRLFELPPAPGASELVRGEARLEDVIAASSIEELKVITAGRCDQPTIKILAQGGMGKLFEQVKPRFDFVIVDSSPILPVADALMIAQQADAVLFSVRGNVSRKTKIFAALQRLSALNVHILGAVVTGGAGGPSERSYYNRYAYPATSAEAIDEPRADS